MVGVSKLQANSFPEELPYKLQTNRSGKNISMTFSRSRPAFFGTVFSGHFVEILEWKSKYLTLFCRQSKEQIILPTHST